MPYMIYEDMLSLQTTTTTTQTRKSLVHISSSSSIKETKLHNPTKRERERDWYLCPMYVLLGSDTVSVSTRHGCGVKRCGSDTAWEECTVMTVYELQWRVD